MMLQFFLLCAVFGGLNCQTPTIEILRRFWNESFPTGIGVKCPYGDAYIKPTSSGLERPDLGMINFIQRFQDCSFSDCPTHCPYGTRCYYDGIYHGCCPTREAVCNSPKNEGDKRCMSVPFMLPMDRWYYDTTAKTCRQFKYYACAGANQRVPLNNFQNRNECDGFCGLTGFSRGGQWLRCPTPGDHPRMNLWTGCVDMCSFQWCPVQTHNCTEMNINGKFTNYCCPDVSRYLNN